MNNCPLFHQTNLSYFGNAQGVRLPMKVLKHANICNTSKDSKIPVQIEAVKDCIIIRRIPQWSAETQSEIIQKINSFTNSSEDSEPISADFENKYCGEKDTFDISLFSGMEEK